MAACFTRLSCVVASPPGEVLLLFRGGKPPWAGAFLAHLLRFCGLLKQGERAVGIDEIGTSGRARAAGQGALRAEFTWGSFARFRSAASREASDFSLLLAMVEGREEAA